MGRVRGKEETFNIKEAPSYLLRQLMSSLISFSQRFSLGRSIHAFRESEFEPIHVCVSARLVGVVDRSHKRQEFEQLTKAMTASILRVSAAATYIQCTTL